MGRGRQRPAGGRDRQVGRRGRGLPLRLSDGPGRRGGEREGAGRDDRISVRRGRRCAPGPGPAFAAGKGHPGTGRAKNRGLRRRGRDTEAARAQGRAPRGAIGCASPRWKVRLRRGTSGGVRQDGADPPLRGTPLPPLPAGACAGHAPSVPGTGGGGGRRLLGAAARRPDLFDAPPGRPPHRQGRLARSDHRGDLGQGDRLRRRQGRTDAPRRFLRRRDGLQRHRRRQHPDRHRQRHGVPSAGPRSRRGELLRRRRVEHRRVPRGAQPRRRPGRARRLRLREQSLRRVDPCRPHDPHRRHRRARRRLRDAGRRGRRHGCGGGLSRRGRWRWRGRARATARP